MIFINFLRLLNPLVLKRAAAKFTKCLFAGTLDEGLNLRICRAARDEYSITKLIALTKDKEAETEISFGDETIKRMTWSNAVNAVLDDVLPSPHLLRVLKTNAQAEHIAEVKVLSPIIVGRTFQKLSLAGCEAVALRRSDSLITAVDSTDLQIGDVLTLVGSREAMTSARELLTTL